MSLGIAFKGPEGIVLAADSRVTLTTRRAGEGGTQTEIPSTFDNATKLLKVNGEDWIAAVTYGLGAFGTPIPRTAHSYMPEFEREVSKNRKTVRLGVEEFSGILGDFFARQWKATMPGAVGQNIQDMVFLIGGFDADKPYGSLYEVRVPSLPKPVELHKDTFGAIWGGQRQFTDRLLQGFDPRLEKVMRRLRAFTDAEWKSTEQSLKAELGVTIPYPFLPLQDCVDLSIFLVKATMVMQSFQAGEVRGVGGAIDVATITRVKGFAPVQTKSIHGERIDNIDRCLSQFPR